MSAGTGITHSEFNHSRSELVHFLQIWILPDKDGVKPSYEQKFYPDEEKRGKWRLIASADGRDNSVTIHQDVNLYAALLEAGEEIIHVVPQNRHAWLQVARGQVVVNGQKLVHGDGLAVSNEERLTVSADISVEVLLFDLS
jgi:hypothetical protein